MHIELAMPSICRAEGWEEFAIIDQLHGATRKTQMVRIPGRGA
jgi:hypothetical protein